MKTGRTLVKEGSGIEGRACGFLAAEYSFPVFLVGLWTKGKCGYCSSTPYQANLITLDPNFPVLSN